MKLNTSYLMLKTDKPVEESPSKLRGYIGSRFEEYPILHHHIKEVGYLYTYPRVQYKIVEGTPYILGIEEGARVLKEISGDLKELVLGNHRYIIKQKIFYEQEAEVKPSRKRQYRFLTPWLALNPENYKVYKEMKDWKEKKEFLNGILVGNILSMCKGLGVVVDRRLYAHSHLDAEKVEYKNVPLLGFTGEFRVNFTIPDFFGLGKGVSQGFGVVKDESPDR
jgi:hypothetical protein